MLISLFKYLTQIFMRCSKIYNVNFNYKNYGVIQKPLANKNPEYKINHKNNTYYYNKC